MKPEIFKAYDIRGRYPDEVNEVVIAEIAGRLAGYFNKGKLVLGHDARLSSPALYESLKKSLVAGHKSLVIIDAGLITSPMLYFLVNHFKAAGGIMITASHNPKQYNGLKVVGKKAVPISGKEIRKLVTGK